MTSKSPDTEKRKRKLSHFLDYRYWRQGIRLLDKQIELAKSGKNHFNNLGMRYYCEGDYSHIKTESYYDKIVSSQLFYALIGHYFTEDYYIPRRKDADVRPYKMISYPLRALHYAIGVYLMHLTKQYRNDYYNNIDNISSYWGGGLSVDNEGKINSLNYSSLYFLKYYDQFAKEARGLIEDDKESNIIHYDINKFYEEVSIPLLLSKVKEYTKDDVRRDHSYDNNTIDLISDVYRKVSSRDGGLPQIGNNIMSKFISSIFMTFADMGVDSILRKSENIKEHKIVRFVDDTYVRLVFKENLEREDKDKTSKYITRDIASYITKNLGLHINNKTRLYRTGVPSETQEFVAGLINTSIVNREGSPVDHLLVGDQVDSQEVPTAEFRYLSDYPESTVEEVVSVLDDLPKEKNGDLNIDERFNVVDRYDRRVLKYVFDDTIREMLHMDDHKETINNVLINVDLDIIYPIWKPIFSLFNISDDSTDRFEKYFLNKSRLTLEDKWICLQFLLKHGSNTKLKRKIEQKSTFGSILKNIDNNNYERDRTGYFGLDFDELESIEGESNTIRQIKYRKINRIEGRISLCLNHLLNEIHSICFNRDEKHKNISSYKSRHVREFLKSNGIRHRRIFKVLDLFNLRNNNPISHPGMDSSPSRFVSIDKYDSVKSFVGKAINSLLSKK